MGASIDGTDFYGLSVSGDTGGWGSGNLDLTDVPDLGNLLGQPSVWIAFVFTSDISIAYPEGAYVDDIVLRKRTSSMAGQPTRSLSCDVVRQADYVLDPCASLDFGTLLDVEPPDDTQRHPDHVAGPYLAEVEGITK